MSDDGRKIDSLPVANGAPKTHPASREWLPADPSEMFAVQVPGDPEVMLALLVEEFLQIGYSVDHIMALAADPNYRALHGMYARWGGERLRTRIEEIARRVGVFRTVATEADSQSCCDEPEVVPLELPADARISAVRKEIM